MWFSPLITREPSRITMITATFTINLIMFYLPRILGIIVVNPTDRSFSIGCFVFSLYILPDRELSNSLLPKFYNWKLSSSLFTIGTLVINIIYFVLLDRLMMAAVQRRTGPYNVGYFGLLPLSQLPLPVLA